MLVSKIKCLVVVLQTPLLSLIIRVAVLVKIPLHGWSILVTPVKKTALTDFDVSP